MLLTQQIVVTDAPIANLVYEFSLIEDEIAVVKR
jgi:hypothetical protein